jgi:hypothetical protein
VSVMAIMTRPLGSEHVFVKRACGGMSENFSEQLTAVANVLLAAFAIVTAALAGLPS